MKLLIISNPETLFLSLFFIVLFIGVIIIGFTYWFLRPFDFNDAPEPEIDFEPGEIDTFDYSKIEEELS